MKTNKFLTIILIVVAVFAVSSCVEDDDYSTPTDLGVQENQNLQDLLSEERGAVEISITDFKAQFVEEEATQIVSDIYLKGYVSSSDQTGNFYREFYLQDQPSNPTAAIKVVLSQVESYNQFNFGREVYISLKDLYIGETRTDDGVIAVGGDKNVDNELESLTINQTPLYVFRSNITETIEPLVVNSSQINDSNIGMFVMIENAFFSDNLAGESFVDPLDDFDTSREISSCDGFGFASFPLETSSFASFSQQILPTGLGGTISGVISKTYDGSNLVMALNKLDDVNLVGALCTPLDINDFMVIFEEDFESMATSADVSGNGWTNFAETGTYHWRVNISNDSGNPGSKIATMGAYNSNSDSNITWLISPEIDLDAQDNQFINFQSSNSFSDNSELELLISTDWDGTEANINSATWDTLPATIVADSEYYQNWVDSGAVEISSYSGTGYIAFKYTGGDNSSNEDGTYEIDNYKVLGL